MGNEKWVFKINIYQLSFQDVTLKASINCKVFCKMKIKKHELNDQTVFFSLHRTAGSFIFRLKKNVLKINDLKMNLKSKGIENVYEKIRSRYIHL